MEIDNGEKPFSVARFLRKVYTEELGSDGGRNHKLLVMAIHAVLLESGFIGYDPYFNTTGTIFQLLQGDWPSSAFILSLSYTLPDIIAPWQQYFVLRELAPNYIDSITLKFQSLGKFLIVYGSLVNGTETHMMYLEEDKLVPILNEVRIPSVAEREVCEFWRGVKDKIALPLLIDLCEKANLGLPPCFMSLPTEIKLKILESLPGTEIARMGCVCSEFRDFSSKSNDDLWKHKYFEQFCNNGNNVVMGGRNWKERFARSCESQKRNNKVPPCQNLKLWGRYKGKAWTGHRRGTCPLAGPHHVRATTPTKKWTKCWVHWLYAAYTSPCR